MPVFGGRSATLPPMAAPEHDETFVEKLSRQGEEALGKIAEELIANPVVNGAIARAFEAREKAVQAQEAAMGALNLPSAADVERVTRRLRSLSQRLEGIEDAIDRLEERLAAARRPSEPIASVEDRLDEIARDVAALRESVSPAETPVPRAQERLDGHRVRPTARAPRSRPRRAQADPLELARRPPAGRRLRPARR